MGGRNLHLSIFDPALQPSDHRPCLLAIHGGGWVGGKPDAAYGIASCFADRGLIEVGPQYRFINPGRVVRYKGPLAFSGAMTKAGNTCKFLSYETGNHGFMMHNPDQLKISMDQGADFLKSQGLMPLVAP